jgi:hypothetical protein
MHNILDQRLELKSILKEIVGSKDMVSMHYWAT